LEIAEDILSENDIELHFHNGMIDVLGERTETPRSLQRWEAADDHLPMQRNQ
jgi:hypothetical protein